MHQAVSRSEKNHHNPWDHRAKIQMGADNKHTSKQVHQQETFRAM